MDSNSHHQVENNEIQISQKFTKDDLVRGFELSKDLYTIGIKEKPTQGQNEVIEKYQALKNIKNFLLTLDHNVLMSQ